MIKVPVVYNGMDSLYLKMVNNPFLQMTEEPVYLFISVRERESKDEKFYLLAGLLLFLGFIKSVFGKYFNNIFRLFFQATFRQKQTREHLAQNNLPALFFNIFFIFSGAAFVTFLFERYNWFNANFWILFTGVFVVLLVLYLGKFLFINFAGWVFNVKNAADTYIFVVFLVSKILGIAIIPFTLLLAFSFPGVISMAVTLSFLLIGSLFIYRYLMSFGSVNKDMKLSPLHFFLYIVAFEIMPILLISRTLMIYLNNTL